MGADKTLRSLEAQIERLHAALCDKQRAVEELTARRDHFDILLKTIPHGILENNLDGTITFSNTAHHRILGFHDGELIGRKVWDLVADPDERKKMPGWLRQLAKKQPDPTPYFSQNRTRDGRMISIKVDWNYKRGAGDEVVGFISVVTDITAQLETTKALEESSRRYGAIFEGSGEGILVADIESRTFRFANPAICRFLGYDEQDLTGMSVYDIHPAKDMDRIIREFEDQAAGMKLLAAQVPCLRKDGAVVYADIRTSRIKIDNRMCLVGFFADVTQHLNVKAKLSEQVLFLQTLIDTLPHPIFYKDTEARYLGCNKAFEAFIGLTKEELVGKTVHDIAPKELADVYEAADKALLKSHDHQIYEASVRYADGSLRPVIFYKAAFFHKNGALGGLAGAMVDITARKQAEEERALLATAIEQSPELIIITDLNGRIHYVNPAFEQISGYTKSEAVGRSPAMINSGRHPAELYAAMWGRLQSGKTWTGRMTNRRKDGRLFEVEATIVPVQRKNGAVSDFLAVERDITNELMRDKQMRQAQKMEAIGTLAGGIAHDFNNILSAIVGYTDIALHDLAADDPMSNYLKKVLKAGERARGLVNQILDFSRASDKRPRPVGVSNIIKEVLKLLRATLPSTIDIRYDINSKAAILADPTQIHQVVMNLCTNAAHAMQEKGGELTIALMDTVVDDLAPEKYATLKAGAYIMLTISDTGEGISAEVMDRVFDPFFTTKKPGEGTGMGLAVVHGIVQETGGGIYLESAPGKGSSFEVLLPAIEFAQNDELPMDEHLALGNEHILLVDDEPDIVDVTTKMLSLLGYEVTAVQDSQAALKLFRRMPDRFDLVVTDMTMPNMTGDILGQHMLSVRHDIPIIITTGYSEKISEASITSMGFAGIAHKPLIISDLASMIRRALDAVG